ncbi:hypothetical protein [Saprospira grandis]|uniref:hypothetical protein n=1 Tax=Saprospira grandis TaxID=1008 RepID=UPI0022DE6096|nr:hypothetical protein [Saprospira grandis]WBM74404.1 hypothetical protein OP864_15570 [Saprospira grandis]
MLSCQNQEKAQPSSNIEEELKPKKVEQIRSPDNLFYYGNFLGALDEDSLASNGIRIFLAQNFGAPSYLFTLKEQSENSFMLVAKTCGGIDLDEDYEVLYKTENIKKEIWDSVVLILNDNDFLNIPEEERMKGHDDSDGWCIEANLNGKTNLVSRKFTTDEEMYKRLLRPIKEVLAIDSSAYVERMID